LLDTLITSKTRLKLLLKFFLNSNSRSYLRNLEQEFGESTNAIRLELNRFEEAGLLSSDIQGNRKYFSANTKHPLYADINSILRKYTGIDLVIDNILHGLGGVKKAYATGDLAKGRESNTIDLIIIGTGIDESYLITLIRKVEKMINRKISYFLLKPGEEQKFLPHYPEALLLWEERLRVAKKRRSEVVK
jgi:hypothetical protein